MNNSKLIYLLDTFSKEEFKSFEKFINSPFFSTGRKVSGLFTVLKKYYPSFPPEKMTKESLLREIFLLEKPKEKKLVNMLSDLTQMADEFLIQLRLSRNQDKKEQMLAYEYKDRKLEKYYLSSIRMIETKITNSVFNSFNCFNEQEELETLKQEYYVGNNNWQKAIESKIKYSEYFTLTFVIRYLKTLREKLVCEMAYNVKYENEVLDALDKALDIEKLITDLVKSNYKNSYLLAVYFYSLKTMENVSDESSYWKMKKLIMNNIVNFSRTEKYILFSDMVSFCAERDRHGDSSYLNEEFSLYQEMLKNDSYSWSEDDYMQVVSFRNIMLVSLSLRELRWLEWFTDNYIDKLRPEYRDNMKNLVMANIKYADRSFGEALSYISKVKYDLFIYKVDVKNLMLRIYYELNMFEEAFYLIDTYRHYLSGSSEMSEANKAQHMNFLNFYSKILRAKSGGNNDELIYSLNEISNMDMISSRNWLTEKINELIKKGAD